MRKSDVKQAGRYGEKYGAEAATDWIRRSPIHMTRQARAATNQHTLELRLKRFLDGYSPLVVSRYLAQIRKADKILRDLGGALGSPRMIAWESVLVAYGFDIPLWRDAVRACLGFDYIAENIRVVAPNGGEHWGIGTTRDITWTSYGIPWNTKLELSRDNGGIWATLYASTPNDGTQPWLVTAPASVLCLVKASSVEIPTVTDQSDAVFSIVVPNIVLTPNTGPAGTPVTVDGQGFTPLTMVAVTFNGTPVANPMTDADGGFSDSFNVPAVPPAIYVVTANDGVVNATDNFTVTL